jgi:hypothetical protein
MKQTQLATVAEEMLRLSKDGYLEEFERVLRRLRPEFLFELEKSSETIDEGVTELVSALASARLSQRLLLAFDGKADRSDLDDVLADKARSLFDRRHKVSKATTSSNSGRSSSVPMELDLAVLVAHLEALSDRRKPIGWRKAGYRASQILRSAGFRVSSYKAWLTQHHLGRLINQARTITDVERLPSKEAVYAALKDIRKN